MCLLVSWEVKEGNSRLQNIWSREATSCLFIQSPVPGTHLGTSMILTSFKMGLKSNWSDSCDYRLHFLKITRLNKSNFFLKFSNPWSSNYSLNGQEPSNSCNSLLPSSNYMLVLYTNLNLYCIDFLSFGRIVFQITQFLLQKGVEK